MTYSKYFSVEMELKAAGDGCYAVGFGVTAPNRKEARRLAWSELEQTLRRDNLEFNRYAWKLESLTEEQTSYSVEFMPVNFEEKREFCVSASNRKEAESRVWTELLQAESKKGNNFDSLDWRIVGVVKSEPSYCIKFDGQNGRRTREFIVGASTQDNAKRLALAELEKITQVRGDSHNRTNWKLSDISKIEPVYTIQMEGWPRDCWRSVGVEANILREAKRLAWIELERDMREEGEKFTRENWRIAKIYRD